MNGFIDKLYLMIVRDGKREYYRISTIGKYYKLKRVKPKRAKEPGAYVITTKKEYVNLHPKPNINYMHTDDNIKYTLKELMYMVIFHIGFDHIDIITKRPLQVRLNNLKYLRSKKDEHLFMGCDFWIYGPDDTLDYNKLLETMKEYEDIYIHNNVLLGYDTRDNNIKFLDPDTKTELTPKEIVNRLQK